MSCVTSVRRGMQMGAVLHIINDIQKRYQDEARNNPDIRIALETPLETLRNLGNIDLEILKKIILGDDPVKNIASTALAAYITNGIAQLNLFMGLDHKSDISTYFNRCLLYLYDKSGNMIDDNVLTDFIWSIAGVMFGEGTMSSTKKIADVCCRTITSLSITTLEAFPRLRNTPSRLYDLVGSVWNLLILAPNSAVRLTYRE